MYICMCAYTYMFRHTHTYTVDYYSTIKNNEILASVTTWMDLKGTVLGAISQTSKDKYYMVSLICGIKKKNKLIGTENRLVVARNGGLRVGEMAEEGQRVKAKI